MVPKFEKRVKAYAADLSALTIAFIIASLGIKPVWGKVTLITVVFLGTSIIPLIISKGQTFGKRIQKIKVVNKDGSDASIIKLLLRNIFKNVASIATMGIYSVIAYFFLTEKHVSMTIHDYIFKTKVIDLSPVKPINDKHEFMSKTDSIKRRGL